MLLHHQAVRAYTIRRAMLRPDRYVAAALAEWPDEDLAYAMRADRATVWRLRLCGYPRAGWWAPTSACCGRSCERSAYGHNRRAGLARFPARPWPSKRRTSPMDRL